MRKLMLVLMCATTMTSMAACGAKEPVTPEVTKAVTETKTAEEQETVSETVGMPNPWTDCKNLNEAEDNVGFSITVPEKIDGYTKKSSRYFTKKTISQIALFLLEKELVLMTSAVITTHTTRKHSWI